LAKLVRAAVIRSALQRKLVKEKKARVEDAMHATRAVVKRELFPAAAWPGALHSRAEKLDDDEKIGVVS
jgi:hypothetical protein